MAVIIVIGELMVGNPGKPDLRARWSANPRPSATAAKLLAVAGRILPFKDSHGNSGVSANASNGCPRDQTWPIQPQSCDQPWLLWVEPGRGRLVRPVSGSPSRTGGIRFDSADLNAHVVHVAGHPWAELGRGPLLHHCPGTRRPSSGKPGFQHLALG